MRKNCFIVFAIILLLSGCDVIRQVGQMALLTKCQFRLKTVDNISLAGVNLQNVSNFSNLSFADAAKITTAYAAGNMPLNLTLNVEAQNLNTNEAGLVKMAWQLFIDGVHIVEGVTDQRVIIPANGGAATIPLTIGVNLLNAIKGESGQALANLAMNIVGEGNKPSKLTLKAKPSIEVNGIYIDYPDYLTIENEFTSK